MDIYRGIAEAVDAAGDNEPGTRGQLDKYMGWFTLAVSVGMMAAFKGTEIAAFVTDQIDNVRSIFDGTQQ